MNVNFDRNKKHAIELKDAALRAGSGGSSKRQSIMDAFVSPSK